MHLAIRKRISIFRGHTWANDRTTNGKSDPAPNYTKHQVIDEQYQFCNISQATGDMGIKLPMALQKMTSKIERSVILKI